MEPSSFLMRFRWSIRHGGRSTARSAPRLASAIGGLLSSVPWPYPKTPAIPRSRVFSSAKDRCGKRFRLWIWRSTTSNNSGRKPSDPALVYRGDWTHDNHSFAEPDRRTVSFTDVPDAEVEID